ncbi:MAG TPA: tripartite tricarboxylate transporter substrate binding protein [Burkholderiaceae bacterium]|nr:tripartite tricarboxylate transporter substrate binding protein [Burkholderiaceae bacterium]
MTHLRRRTILAAGLALALGAHRPAPAQEGAVTIVVPFPPGGLTDRVAMALQPLLSRGLGQPVSIEHRGGAAGNVGARSVAVSPADGRTLLLTFDSTLTANPAIYRERLGYDAERELVPVATVGDFGPLLATGATSGLSDFAQFAATARQGGLSYASGGVGSPGHLSMEMLLASVGASRGLHEPYRGAMPATQAITSGEVQAAYLVAPTVEREIAAGMLRVLAVAGRTRSRLVPDAPTLVELGHPAAVAEFTFVIAAARGTPEALVQRLNAEVRNALEQDALREPLRQLDVAPRASTPAETAAVLAAARQRWTKVVAARGLRV